MARTYGEDQNAWETEPPRPDPPGERDFKDDTPGNAAKDGYTALRRRPLSNMAGDWLTLEEANRVDEMDKNSPFGGSPMMDW
jgi:hypothetical protein